MIHGGKSNFVGDKVTIHLKYNHQIKISIDHHQLNLLILYNSFVTKEGKRRIGPAMRSALARSRLMRLAFSGDFQATGDMCHLATGSTDSSFEE